MTLWDVDRTEATTAGKYTSPGWGKSYPRLQLLTIAELLRDAAIAMPPAMAPLPRRPGNAGQGAARMLKYVRDLETYIHSSWPTDQQAPVCGVRCGATIADLFACGKGVAVSRPVAPTGRCLIPASRLGGPPSSLIAIYAPPLLLSNPSRALSFPHEATYIDMDPETCYTGVAPTGPPVGLLYI